MCIKQGERIFRNNPLLVYVCMNNSRIMVNLHVCGTIDGLLIWLFLDVNFFLFWLFLDA